MASWSSLPPTPVDGLPRSPDRFRMRTDGFRQDYDEYNQDRYSSGRRDSADYAGRDLDMRRRSPSRMSIEDRGKRKRSLSPPSRFVRPRYDEQGFRGHSPGRYSPDRERERDRRPRGPPDPMSADSLVSFRTFVEWFKYKHPGEYHEDEQSRRDQPADGQPTDESSSKDANSSTVAKPLVRVRYEEYRRRFMRRQYKSMFEYHRKLAWFVEKYDPSERYDDLRARVKKEGMQGTIDQFVVELEAGKHDPALDMPAVTEETSIEEVQEEDQEMAAANPEDSESKAASRPANGHETKSLNPGEFSVLPPGPQLMIRTIPPDIGRLKLEQVFVSLSGFKYIAIGDPVQKRQFYRPGWVAFEFEEDAKRALEELEAKKIDNFKLPLTHTTSAFVSKVRQTPACASKPERLEKDLEQAKRLVAAFENEASTLATYKPRWPVGAAPDAPLPEPDQHAPTEDDDDIGSPHRGSAAVEQRIDRLVSERIDTDENGEPVGSKRFELALDLYLAYLRHAFHCCYYCAVVCDHAEELVRKCIKHERKPEGGKEEAEVSNEKDRDRTKKNDAFSEERWGEMLDSKLACMLNRAEVDPTDYGGSKYDDELSAVAAPFVQQEEESRWRCRDCKKLFKAGAFVEKHIANKHPELVKAKLEDWEFYNNFVLDPQRILPMQAVPVSMNGTMPHPPQAFGLPSNWRPADFRDRMDTNMPYPPPPRNTHGSQGKFGGAVGGSHHSHNPPQYLRPMRRESSPGRASSYGATSAPMIPLPAIPGLPAKPVDAQGMSATPLPQSRRQSSTGGVPPPPAGAKPDPRQRVSYHDLDKVAAADDVELQY